MTSTQLGVEAAPIAAGFADPVFEAQACFRAVLECLAEPGTERPIAGIVEAPAPLSPVAAAVTATLADWETALWRDARLATPAIDAWLAFHTGAPVTDASSRAVFALIGDVEGLAPYDAFALGTDVDPSTSATLILQVAGIGEGTRYRLTGPGIETTREIALLGAPIDLAARAATNHALYPRGVDLVLAGPTSVVGLPRTTRIEEIA